MPIVEAVYKVLYEDKKAETMVKELCPVILKRSFKSILKL